MLISLILFFFSARPSFVLGSMNLPATTQQVVLVETDSWTSTTGELQLLSRTPGGWVAVGAKIPVSLGKNGLAWGRGLQQEVADGPQKVEGDGKATAGVFHLGTAFGYEPGPPPGCKLPYRQATDRDFFVDDPHSADYNTWVTLPAAGWEKPWKSAETLRRTDYLYELGIVVLQNSAPVVRGKGSAVFLHIWRNPGSPTAGCTAMAKDNLQALLAWLDPAKQPLLIQAPRGEMHKIRIADAPK